MAEFTRLTLAYGASRIDAVVASDQPLAVLLPRITDLVDVPAGAGPFTLVRPMGDSLDLARDCRDNELADGEIVYLVEWADAPAPPAVTDVTDTVAALQAGMAGVWDARARRIVAAGMICVLCLAAGMVAPWGTLDAWVPAVVALVLSVVAVPAGRAGSVWAGMALCAASVGLSVPAGWRMAGLLHGASSVQVGVLSVMLVFWIVIGIGIGVGLRCKPAAVGGVVCAVIAGIGLVLAGAGVRADAVWGVVGLIAVVSLGLVPTWAISVSGLTGLDDFAAGGEAVPRERVVVSLADAYAAVGWCAAGTAVLAGCSAGLMAALGGGPWALVMAGILVVVLALRVRALPTAVPATVVWLSVLAGLFGLLWGLPPWWQLAGLLAVAAVAGVAVDVRVPDHVQIRLRGWANGLDKIAMAVSVPVLVGVFGLYAHLVGAFS